ncbi:MAG: carboxy terminal-processing peptidase [Opitutaceae bacterium]|nr:carboxy terminal-processing peptidase [Opitutaceae bacterium]
MIHAFRNLRSHVTTFALVLSVTAGFAADDRKQFSTSTTLAAEAMTLTKLLDELHYNHDSVRSADFASVIPDYMEELDGQRLFFLRTDREKFEADFGRNVYYNTAFLGNINAAYDIFYVYQTRVQTRIAWIFEQLNGEFDFTAADTYRADRAKAEWPADPAASDELWQKRLKFELLAEVLNKKTLDEAKEKVKKRYDRMLKNLSEIEGKDLAEIYLTTIAKLYDPHSTYFSAETYEDFGIQMRLKLVGIGALLGVEDDICVVKEIVPGGPADLGRQLKPNDKIISVGEKGGEAVDIFGMKLRKIVDKIRGKKGTEVSLIVQPADAADSSVRREILITRDTVKLNSARARAGVFDVPAEGTEGKTRKLGVITLPAFYAEGDEGDTDSERSSASKDVARLIEILKKENIEGLVLDLRRNGGGFLAEAIELAGLFIQKGPIVQVKNFTGEIHVDRDKDPRIAYTGPLAVLVDRFSASASEIVTGALQNYGRAIVVGDSSTHGKGTVQQVIEMKQLSIPLARSPQKTGAAKFTIQKYYLPSGASTQLKGVVPDIVLPSIEDHLPIGEADLPRALVWDQIKSSEFEGEPLNPKVLTPLRQASLDRQSKLEEFVYLRKQVDTFKTRQEQKLISLNLEERQRQKASDDQLRKEMKAEKDRLAKNDFTFKPFYLGPPPAPRIKAPKKDDEEDFDSDDENETYAKVDVHLREALRVVNDAVELGGNRDLWASNRAPLTARTPSGG